MCVVIYALKQFFRNLLKHGGTGSYSICETRACTAESSKMSKYNSEIEDIESSMFFCVLTVFYLLFLSFYRYIYSC